MSGQQDFLSERGAVRLAAKIAGYWTERGYAVGVWCEKLAFEPRHARAAFVVRSTLKNGLPARTLTRAAAGGAA